MMNETIGVALQQLSEHNEVSVVDMETSKEYMIVDCIFSYDEIKRKKKVQFMVKKY